MSIAAELIQLRWGGTGHPLTATEGRIHHQFALGLAADAAAHGMLPAGGRSPRLGPPFGDPGKPRFDELEAVEEAQHLGRWPDVQLGRCLAGNSALPPSPRASSSTVPWVMAQVTARRHVVPVCRDDLVRFRFVADEVQGTGAQHRYRPGQVDQPGDSRVLQDGSRVAQVAEHHANPVPRT